MTICSLVIQTLPKHLEQVSQTLLDIDGVEIHAQDQTGKLIVSIDHPSRSYCGNTMTRMTRLKGVMSTSLVYEYQEDLEASSLTPTPSSSINGEIK
jgi:nitrate reductase NapD